MMNSSRAWSQRDFFTRFACSFSRPNDVIEHCFGDHRLIASGLRRADWYPPRLHEEGSPFRHVTGRNGAFTLGSLDAGGIYATLVPTGNTLLNAMVNGLARLPMHRSPTAACCI
jgi:hypothetical protein